MNGTYFLLFHHQAPVSANFTSSVRTGEEEYIAYQLLLFPVQYPVSKLSTDPARRFYNHLQLLPLCYAIEQHRVSDLVPNAELFFFRVQWHSQFGLSKGPISQPRTPVRSGLL